VRYLTILMTLLRLPATQKRTILLLSIGSFLEWFDLFLYAHMAVLLNDLFFPPTNTHTQSLLSAFSFCTSFIFRPFGALLFGYIGDKYGRRITVVMTTFMMAGTCMMMALAPTYDQVGITAAWIITFCRIVQGITSMGEITAAQLLLTETTPLPARFPVVGIIGISCILGSTTAIAVGVLATSVGFNWRIAFMVGTCIAVIGMLARTTLRESAEFADASRRLKNAFKLLKQNPQAVQQNWIDHSKVNYKTALAYFGILCAGPIYLYFAYFYCPTILKHSFQYTTHQVLVHNLLLAITELIGVSMLRTYLASILHPIKILGYNWIALFILSLLTPWLLNHITAVYQLFLVQIFLLLLRVYDFPAIPIFYKSFPVFKRFTAVSFLYSMAYAVSYAITTFFLTHLIAYWGYWGLWVLMVPALVGYGFGLNYFIQQERAANRYPHLPLSEMNEGVN
jgi:MHS family proline/betaine transporter-like MFS transporter